MGLFTGKQQPKKDSQTDEALEAAENLFDGAFRDEIRNYGRDYFKKILNENAAHFTKDLDASIAQIHTDLKAYMTTQIDESIAQINAKLTEQLDERIVAYDRMAKDAQDQAVQSLNRNAQALHEKYHQLSQMLQQTVSSQEVLMITAFEENKARLTAAQAAQDVVTESVNRSSQASREQAEQLSASVKQTISEQEAMLKDVFEENKTRVETTKVAQDAALQSLNASAETLKEQADQLNATLQQNIVNQEAIMTNAIQENMARIIEHYLLGALGDQYDMKAQLPLIIKQMDANKQAIMDDMKL